MTNKRECYFKKKKKKKQKKALTLVVDFHETQP